MGRLAQRGRIAAVRLVDARRDVAGCGGAGAVGRYRRASLAGNLGLQAGQRRSDRAGGRGRGQAAGGHRLAASHPARGEYASATRITPPPSRTWTSATDPPRALSTRAVVDWNQRWLCHAVHRWHLRQLPERRVNGPATGGHHPHAAGTLCDHAPVFIGPAPPRGTNYLRQAGQLQRSAKVSDARRAGIPVGARRHDRRPGTLLPHRRARHVGHTQHGELHRNHRPLLAPRARHDLRGPPCPGFLHAPCVPVTAWPSRCCSSLADGVAGAACRESRTSHPNPLLTRSNELGQAQPDVHPRRLGVDGLELHARRDWATATGIRATEPMVIGRPSAMAWLTTRTPSTAPPVTATGTLVPQHELHRRAGRRLSRQFGDSINLTGSFYYAVHRHRAGTQLEVQRLGRGRSPPPRSITECLSAINASARACPAGSPVSTVDSPQPQSPEAELCELASRTTPAASC